MGRLIDEEQVINVLKETGIIVDNDLGHLVVDEINRISTAYDVEKVVAEVEDYHDLVKGCYLKEIVEIIKKGGVE